MDRMTILMTLGTRGALTLDGVSGVVQSIEHEDGSGRNWLVKLVGTSTIRTVLVTFSRDMIVRTVRALPVVARLA
jgi:hypothetical protein